MRALRAENAPSEFRNFASFVVSFPSRAITQAYSLLPHGVIHLPPLRALTLALLLCLASGLARAENAIVVENQLAGRPSTEWDVAGAGDPSIQGFATDISVAPGETVQFKIDTRRDRLPPRHLPARLVRRSRRAEGRDASSRRRRCPRPSPRA